ncbi:MAG: DUF2851 family protein [Opitutaceae bacterium]|jgi:hypothetical protein
MSKQSKTSKQPVFAGEAVAEVQGLYGPFTFPERLLQKIWQRSDYDGSGLRTAAGQGLTVVYPGRWNHLGGPDFDGARLIIGGREVVGDVELHLHAKDWAAHGHADDPAYDNVLLHVVLFPCAETHTKGASGREIPILCLLPRLHHGLEEYAADEAMEHLAGRPLHQALEILGALDREALNETLSTHASRRWRSKVHFAGERIKRLGWEGACHHAAMEILGYRFNRAPMLTVATTWPLGDWAAGRVDPAMIFEELAGRWALQGVRPLNHPLLRLRQYSEWCKSCPDWPVRLREDSGLHALASATIDASVGEWRRTVRLTSIRGGLKTRICGGVIGGSRLDNLIADGFMPLLAAEAGLDLESAWSGWFVGDAPAVVVEVLRQLDVFDGRGRPVAMGPVQGLLGWMLEREACARG